MAIATGNDKTIPQKPEIIPPADTANITSNGCNEFVLPYTLGPITLPSKIGHIMHISTVNAVTKYLLFIMHSVCACFDSLRDIYQAFFNQFVPIIL